MNPDMRRIEQVEPVGVEPFDCPGCHRRMQLKWSKRDAVCFACMTKRKLKTGEYKRRFQ